MTSEFSIEVMPPTRDGHTHTPKSRKPAPMAPISGRTTPLRLTMIR